MKHPKENQFVLPGTIETPTSSPQLSEREKLLVRTAAHLPKDFDPEELKDWKRMMDNFSLEDLTFAFQKWIDNERFFPKIIDIRQIIGCKHEQERLEAEAEMMKSYIGKGGGYGSNDVLVLWVIFLERYPRPIGRRLTAAERVELVNELERRRKQAAA